MKHYYEFVLSHGIGMTPRYYLHLPTNVHEAAEFAVSKIN